MTTVQTTTQTVMPAQAQERIQRIDIVRGCALFGILLVNMLDFGGVVDAPRDTSWLGGANVLANWFIRFAAQGKFIAMFSILFGLSLSLQTRRLEERSVSSPWLLVRRMLVLFSIGLLHTILLWDGDILTRYSLLGLVFLAFSHTSQRTSMRWATGFYVFTILLTIALTLLSLGQSWLLSADHTTEHRSPSPGKLSRSYRI